MRTTMKTLRNLLSDLGIRTPHKATLCVYEPHSMSFYTEHSDALFHHGDTVLKATQREALHLLQLRTPSGYLALDMPVPANTIQE
jgi:hypothetical protein